MLGLGVLGWSAYDLLWNPLVDPHVAAHEASGLRAQWQVPLENPRPAEPVGEPSDAPLGTEPTVTESPGAEVTATTPGGATSTGDAAEAYKTPPGHAVALLRIPKFGADFEQPVLAGTDQPTLKRGLGWYAGSAAPGEVGNFAVAGHRGSKGPFAPIMELAVGDQVIVETRTAVYTYELTNNPADLTVKDTETWVLQPVPGRPEVKPTEALLTLTTCQDLFHSDDRTIGFAKLVSTQPK